MRRPGQRRSSPPRRMAEAPQHHGRRRHGARHARLFRRAIFDALDDAYYLMNDLSIGEAAAGGRERHPLGQGTRRADDETIAGTWRPPSRASPQPGTGAGGANEPARRLRSRDRHRHGIRLRREPGRRALQRKRGAVLPSILFSPRHRQVERRLLHDQRPRPAEPPRTDLTDLAHHQRRAPRRCRHPWRLEGQRREGTGRETSPQGVEAKEPAHRDRAHFTRADLASFSDFKSLKKSFDHVRGTFASVKRPTIREIRMPNGARVKATLTLFDTRLLAPAGAGKLKDLGNLIGLPKLEVPDVVNEKGETVPGIDENGPRLRPPPGRVRSIRHPDAEVSVTLSAPRRRVRRELGLDEDASDRRQHRHDAAEKRRQPHPARDTRPRPDQAGPHRRPDRGGAGNPVARRRCLSRRPQRGIRPRHLHRDAGAALRRLRPEGLLHDRDGRFPGSGLGSDRAHEGPVTPCRPRRPDDRQRRLRVPGRHAISLPAGQHRRRRPGLPARPAAPR